MFILQICPISKGLPKESFSYFSKEFTNPGSLVEIKINNRLLFGLVIYTTDLIKEKMVIKNSNFSMRKIERIIQENFIEKNLLYSLLNISSLLNTTVGNLIHTFTLKDALIDLINLIEVTNKVQQTETDKNVKSINKIYKIKEKEEIFNNQKNENGKTEIILDEFENRIKIYKNIATDSLAKKESLLIYFPTINELEYAKKEIEKGIEKYCLTLHSDFSKKKLKRELTELNKENNYFIIFSTSSLLLFFVKEKINLKTIILEKENSYNYFTHHSGVPIDFREVIKYIGQANDLNLILGSHIPSLPTYLELKNGEIKKYHKLNQQIIDENIKKEIQDHIFILDMKLKTPNLEMQNKRDLKYDKTYFGPEVIKLLEEIKTKKIGKVFIYTKRRGLYTETVCNDCSEVLTCKTCKKPLVLFNKKIREYVCPFCKIKIGLVENQELNCQNCKSWNLRPLGIGSEGVTKNLEEVGFKTFILDSEHIKTKKEGKKIIQEFLAEPIAILVGTELALNFLEKKMKLDVIIIASLDSLFYLPEINIDEKILNLVSDLTNILSFSETEKNKSKNNLFIQTRLINHPIWNVIKEQQYLKFLDEELETRRDLNLPPFINILKIILDKKNLHLKNSIEKIFGKNIKILWYSKKENNDEFGLIFIPKNLWQKRNESNKIIPTDFCKNISQQLSNFHIETQPERLYT